MIDYLSCMDEIRQAVPSLSVAGMALVPSQHAVTPGEVAFFLRPSIGGQTRVVRIDLPRGSVVPPGGTQDRVRQVIEAHDPARRGTVVRAKRTEIEVLEAKIESGQAVPGDAEALERLRLQLRRLGPE